jgi:hypothetical protein
MRDLLNGFLSMNRMRPVPPASVSTVIYVYEKLQLWWLSLPALVGAADFQLPVTFSVRSLK